MLSKHTSDVLDTKLHMQCIHLIFKYFIDVFDTTEYNFKRYLIGRKEGPFNHVKKLLLKLIF